MEGKKNIFIIKISMYFRFFVFLGEYVRGVKILIYRSPNLRTGVLSDVVIHCKDEHELTNALIEYHALKIIIVCNSNELIGLDILLSNYSIDTLFVINNVQDHDIREWLDGLIFNNTIEVQTEEKLIYHLCTMIVSCYYNQSIEYRQKENYGKANLCILDSLKVIDFLTKIV